MVELSDLLIGVMCGALTMFLNYCLGSPSSKKFSPYEIFSNYTVLLAKRRLKQVGLFYTYKNELGSNLQRASTVSERIAINNDFKKMLYEVAEPYFTWERAAGVCPVCTGVWITLGTSLAFTQNILHLFTKINFSRDQTTCKCLL